MTVLSVPAASAESLLFRRISGLLLVRGITLILLAAIALRWPEFGLVGAMTAAGAFAGLTGLYELGASIASHERPSTRYFVTGHAAAIVGFGAVTLALSLASLRFAFIVTVLWLLANATFALLLAARTWWYRSVRLVLIAWSAVSVSAALALTFATTVKATSLLYALALYAALWGLLQIAASRWIQGWLWRRDAARPSDTPITRV
jgi:hypothetical protein